MPTADFFATVWRSTIITIVLWGVGGCVTIYDYQPVAVSVVDAEDGTPLAGARVEVHYRTDDIHLVYPSPAVGVCDAQGNTTVRAGRRTGGTSGAPGWLISRDGYITVHFSVSEDRRVPRELITAARPDAAVVRLYRDPLPRILYIVPEGYEGLVVVDWYQTENDADLAPPFERDFRVAVDKEGRARLAVTPLLSQNYAIASTEGDFSLGRDAPRVESHFMPWTFENAPSALPPNTRGVWILNRDYPDGSSVSGRLRYFIGLLGDARKAAVTASRPRSRQ